MYSSNWPYKFLLKNARSRISDRYVFLLSNDRSTPCLKASRVPQSVLQLPPVLSHSSILDPSIPGMKTMRGTKRISSLWRFLYHSAGSGRSIETAGFASLWSGSPVGGDGGC